MSAALHVLQPGLQTTVQDLGRFGWQAYGVPVCGALDPLALQIANALIGNTPGAAALEIRLLGPQLEVRGGRIRLALAGAEARLEVTRDGQTDSFPAWRAVDVAEGAQVRVSPLSGSGCAVLAVAGGIEVPLVLGSRSTDLKGRFGGHEGRALAAGDTVPIGAAALAGPCLELPSPPPLAFAGTLRVVLGPQAEAFSAKGLETFLGQPFRISREADRMGMRLEGPPLAFTGGADIVSDGIATGAIQVPGSGLPIVLLSDHQTIGGYAKIATVISADLPLAGRLLPGTEIRFEAVSVAAAEEARRAQARGLRTMIDSLTEVRETAQVNVAALFGANLISGVVTAFETEY